MEQQSTILIVDDELFGRKTLGMLLNTPLYTLAFAQNGAEALALAARLTPDLILLDVMMPDMDGFEVCRRLRADPHLADVPVIIVTSLDDRESRLQGIESGADDLVSKPFDPVELRARVRTITRLNRYRRLLIERAKFERVTELAPDGIVIVDAEGEILLSNPAFVRMLGADDPEHILGKNVLSLIAPDSAAYCAAWLESILHNSAYINRIETMFVRLDRSWFPVEVNAGHIIWDGSPAIQIIVRDSTERKQAEEALRRSEEHLRRSRDVLQAIFDGLDDGLLLLDSEGRVLVVNQAMATLLGVEPSTMVGQSWEGLCTQLQPAFPGQSALKALHDGRARRHREHYTKAQAQTYILDIQILPLMGPEQSVDQVIVHVMDVSERIHLEALVIQNEQFAARGRMAATIAHEVNTPLQSIQNCLYLAGNAKEDQRWRYLELACEELERISTIVRQLLDHHTSDEAGVPSTFNLNMLIERVLVLTGSTLARHGIDVTCDFISDPPLFSGYADHLTQVFLNIVLNAVDAMPDGGKLRVQTQVVANTRGSAIDADSRTDAAPTVERSTTNGTHLFVIKVTDTGVGIHPEVQARIFEPFFTTKASGSGVGLAVSQRIVVQHYGEMTVQSVPGGGSTFTVTLPLSCSM